jgi:hypothetical protein
LYFDDYHIYFHLRHFHFARLPLRLAWLCQLSIRRHWA